MADNTNISIGFNTKEAQQEIKALSNTLKQTQNDFKVTDATLKTTGSSLDRLNNKYQSLSKQVSQQSEITSKYKQMVEQAAKAQESARQRLEKANAAYEDGKTSLKGNSDELKKLKDEVEKAQNAVKTADNNFNRFSNSLSRSQLAEANLRNELSQTSDEIQKQSKFIAQVKDNYDKLQEKTEGVQKGMTATGKVLTAGVTTPIVALAGYAVNSMNKVDEGLDTVMTKTGATGQEAKELQSVYMDVAKTVPAAYGDIGASVGEINTRLGFTGELLKTASTDFLKFAKVNGTDVNTSVQLVTRAMGDASIPAEEYKSVLDSITVAGQKSGISVDTLATNLAKYGAPMRALGIDTKNAIALFAGWEKAGVNTEIAFSGMKKAISNWGAEGKDSRTEFAKTLEEIKNAPDIAAATTKAIEVFGSKAGPDLADAIQGGRFEVEQYLDALSKADGAVDNTYGMIVDEVDDTQLAIQNLEVGFHDLGESIAKNVGPVALDVAEDIGTLVGKFGELDSGTQKNILKFALLAAAIGPLLSIGSKGIAVVNGGIAAVKTITGLLSGATAATTAAGTAASAAGTAVASGATTAGAAVTTAGQAAATAAGAGGIGAFLSALGTVAGVSAGVTAVVTSPFIATLGVAAAAGEAIDGYYEKLGQSGEEALSNAQSYSEKVKTAYDMSEEAETVRTYYNRYNELLDLRNRGFQTAESEKERKEIEQWFIDNYGDYISAEEKKNGVHQETLDFIRQITQAEKERAEAESLAARKEIRENSEEKRNDAVKAEQEMPKLKSSISSMENQIAEAEKLSQNLTILKQKYDAINNTMSGEERRKAVEQLREDNKDIFNSYEQLTGGQLSFEGIEQGIENINTRTEEWNNNIAGQQERISSLQGSIDAYKETLIILQNTITGEVLNNVGFDNIYDLFSSGDTDLIQKALNDVAVQCQLLGMTSEETGLQVALFKNGFSNLNEAMSGGDKVMKNVVSDMNEYMHTVVGLPENIQFSINADGDITMIDTAKEGIDDIDGEEAEVSVQIDGGDSEQTVTTLQDLINKFGASKAVALLQADDNATVTIDGVTYRLTEYDSETGIATLQADGSEAAITIDTTTGQVYGFNDVEGTAVLKVNNTQANKAIDTTRNKLVGFERTYTANLSFNARYPNSIFAQPKAKGTQDFEGGLAMINDEKGVADPRELVEHKGKYYLFEGRNVVLNLDKHDKVFTAKQTQAMLKDIPHFAGGVNNEAFTAAKDDFEYRQKTSIVTDEEALLWWKNILEEYAADAEVVKEANIEIYELTNKINDDKIKEYKDRIKEQESASKDWIDYEVKMNNLSIEEQIAAYGRMDQNYLNTLTEMTENTEMTAEELEEVWSEYYETIRDHEMEVAELKKKNLEQQNQLSLDYIAERTYYNDWDKFSDSPEEAYERIKERNLNALNNGDITTEEYNANMTEAGQSLYEGRLENSKKYLELQRKYGNISDEEYRAGLQRILNYTKQYYESGMISGKYYYEALDEANGNLFDNMSATLENYVNEYYEAQQQMLSDKKAAIEAEYAAIEAAETKEEREKELSQLQAEYEKYKNAVTIDGKKKLQEIQDNIDSLKKEEEQEAREAEKEARLAEVEKEGELLQAEQENALKGISKYTAQALGIIVGGNTEMTEQFNKVVSTYNQQQEQLATSGYNTISKIVDLTNAKLAEIGTNIPYGINENNKQYTVTVTQTFNNTISDETTAMIYGKYAGSSARRGFSEEFEGVK